MSNIARCLSNQSCQPSMCHADAQFMAAVYQESRLLPTDPGTMYAVAQRQV